MRFPGETVVNKDTKVSYTLDRKKRLIIEINCRANSVAMCKGTVDGFGFIHIYSPCFVPRFKGVDMI